MNKEPRLELDKCPFCGADVAEMLNAHDLEECGNFECDCCPCEQYEDVGRCEFHTVVCSINKGGCGASSGYFETEERAAQAWNNRS